MKPAARIAAAIELLGAIEADGEFRAADRMVQNYFRARRYAGSKDRTEVTERVYQILRRRAEIDWWAGRAGLPLTPRGRVITALAVTEHAAGADIAGLFGAGPHTADALSDDERTAIDKLATADTSEAPVWARGAFPEWLTAELEKRFGTDLLAAMTAQLERAPVDLRVNSLKGTRQQALEALKVLGISAAPTPFSPFGIRLDARAKIDDKAIYHSGLVEPQDEGSQLVAILVDAAPRMQIIDLCAGAGGKALAIAAGMENRGQVYACDVDARRLARFNPRIQRAGVRNIQTQVLRDADDDPFLAEMAGKADRVLVDAPCSGTGTWRRNPEARWRLTSETLAALHATQDRLLDRAARLLKPGGRLIYVTCSLLGSENEDRVSAFLGRNPKFTLIPIADVWQRLLGTSCPGDGPMLQLAPHSHGVDGFFVAVLEFSPRRENP